MLTLKCKVVSARFDDSGNPAPELHERVSRGRRNVPVMAASGKPAVDEDGNPKIEVYEFVHVYLQPEGAHPFHLEVPAAQAAEFTIGKEVTLTISAG